MTNKIVLREIDELMADYVPTYQPLYPLLMSKAVKYTTDVGKVNFKRIEATGDLRAKRILPKDTEMHQVSAIEKTKVFKKYVMGNQFTQSELQDQSQNEDVVKQILDEHQVQMDELVLFGDGTSVGTVVNNGLFYSGDSNYTLEDSIEIDTDADPLLDLFAKMQASAHKADQVAGEKLVIAYGADMIAKFDGLFAASSKPFRSAIAEALPTYNFTKLPTKVSSGLGNGWIIVNMSQLKMHYVELPQLYKQGVNDEKMYSWHNFLMGSTMIDVLAKDGIIRQPITFEA